MRDFIREPQMAMVHHVRERFRDRSMNNQRHMSFWQALTRDHSPTAMARRAVATMEAR